MTTSPAASLPNGSNGSDADLPTQEIIGLVSYESVNGSSHGLTDPSETLELIRPIGSAAWRGRFGDAEVAARPLPFAVDALDSPALAARIERLRSAQLAPFLGVTVLDGTSWVVSQYVAGAPLDRLMTAAILTPFQATTVVTEIFGGLAALHRTGLAHGGLDRTAVRIGADGMVRITDWAFATLAAPPLASKHTDLDGESDTAQRRDLAGVVAIAADLARDADRPNSRRSRVDAELLTGLVKLGAVEPASAEQAYERLRHIVRRAAAGRPDRANAQVELAGLVAATTLRTGRPAVDRRPAHPGRWTTSATQGRDSSLSVANWQAPKRRRTIVAMLATVAAVLAVGGVALAPPGRSAIDRLLHHHPKPSSSQTTTASALTVARGGKPRAVVGGAASAGVVSAVVAHARLCRPGRPCAVTVAVRLTPSTRVRRVGWSVTVVDRCTGRRLVRPGGTLRAARGATYVHGHRTVVLPAGRALGLIVATTAPARAAATPLLLPAAAVTC